MAKLADAQKTFKEGEKLVTTGLFRWTPDYENGSTTFEVAGNLFRDAKEFSKAAVAFKKSGECYEKLNVPFKAGQKYEAASTLYKQGKDLDLAFDLAQKAAVCFQMHGSSDKASETFLNASKIAEQSGQIDKAIEIALQSIDLLETDGKHLFVPSNYRCATALLIKNGRIEQALALYKRQIKVHDRLTQTEDTMKCCLCIIVLCLFRDDFVGADKAWSEAVNEYAQFVSSDCGIAAQRLLDAYEKKDVETLKKVQQMQVFTFLDIEVARMVKKLTIGSSGGGKEKAEQQSLA